ncbi:hypothetical protein JCM10213_007714 [Rhodosporidiobolus nylandii]
MSPRSRTASRGPSPPHYSPHAAVAMEDVEPVASTSQLPPPIPASLTMLPPELKALIVQKVAEADMADVDGEDDEGAWSDEDEEGSNGAEGEELVMDGRAGAKGRREKGGWDTLEKLPRGEDGNPTLEALEKVRERLLELAKMSGIEALTLVSKEFNEMAMQWKWRELDFEDTSNESILHLIHHVLPRHARHVQSLAFGQSEAHMLRDDPPGTLGGYDAVDPFLPLPPRRAAIVEAAERFGGVQATFGDGTALSSEVRSRRTRSLLMAEVVRQCTNVVKIDCEGFPKVPAAWAEDLNARDFSDRNIAYPVDHAVEAIKAHLGPKLVDLTFLVNDDGVTDEGDVADLLLSAPNLRRLELEMLVPSGPASNRDRLYSAFQRLTKLETLNVADGSFITDEFAGLDLRWPLKVLALNECEDLSFPAFVTLIERFAPTLECLDVANTPHANVEKDNKALLGRPFNLPKLDTLVLETQHEPLFLQSFAQCPVKTFGLGFCPAFEYRDVEQFLDAHVDTLKRLEIDPDAALTEAQVESLEVLCHARGVEVEMLPAGSDSEDSDLADPSDFDISDDEDDDDDVDQDGWVDDDDDGADGTADWSDEE